MNECCAGSRGLEKYGKKKAEYGKIFPFPDFCPYFVNQEFNENTFIEQEVIFHSRCLFSDCQICTF